jgi:hypothetical protein
LRVSAEPHPGNRQQRKISQTNRQNGKQKEKARPLESSRARPESHPVGFIK